MKLRYAYRWYSRVFMYVVLEVIGSQPNQLFRYENMLAIFYFFTLVNIISQHDVKYLCYCSKQIDPYKWKIHLFDLSFK